MVAQLCTARTVAGAEHISIAMLTVLETLGPVERAVFVLHEAFDTPYDEIAEAVGKTSAAVRQIRSRARQHVALHRPRMQVDTAQQQAAPERLVAAVSTGDVQALMEVLAPEVMAIADGGGLRAAARAPISGADTVAALLARLPTKISELVAPTIWLTGMPAVRIDIGSEDTVLNLAVDNGLITRVHTVRNPHKLEWLDNQAELRR